VRPPEWPDQLEPGAGDGIAGQTPGEWAYGPGDHLIYHAFGGEERHVIVEARYEDIKNGRAGFDAIMLDPSDEGMDTGRTIWGYDDQIISVHRAAAPPDERGV